MCVLVDWGHAPQWNQQEASITSCDLLRPELAPKTSKLITSHDVREPLKQALLASHDVIISSQMWGLKLQRVFTWGDGCWLPMEGSVCWFLWCVCISTWQCIDMEFPGLFLWLLWFGFFICPGQGKHLSLCSPSPGEFFSFSWSLCFCENSGSLCLSLSLYLVVLSFSQSETGRSHSGGGCTVDLRSRWPATDCFRPFGPRLGENGRKMDFGLTGEIGGKMAEKWKYGPKSHFWASPFPWWGQIHSSAILFQNRTEGLKAVCSNAIVTSVDQQGSFVAST